MPEVVRDEREPRIVRHIGLCILVLVECEQVSAFAELFEDCFGVSAAAECDIDIYAVWLDI